MSEDRPVWRQGFDSVEEAVSPLLVEVVNSEQFAIAAGLVLRAQRGAQRRAERATRRLLHLANLPAGSDVTRLLAEIGKLQAQVRELSKQVSSSDGGGGDDGSTRNGGSARTRQARR
jgi:hypothetical protein